MERVFEVGTRGMGIGALVLSMAAWAAASPPVTPDADHDGPHVQVLRTTGGHLGVTLREVEGKDVARLKLPEEQGALVGHVEADSPAAKAGLKEEDVIVRYQGETVHSAAQLSRLVRETPPGRTVSVEVVRDGATQKLSASLGENRGSVMRDFNIQIPPIPALPPELGKNPGLLRERILEGFKVGGPRRLGIEYQGLSGQLAKYFKVEDGGILVSEVEESGPAAKAGIKAGDVILKFDGKAVHDPEEFRREVGRAEPGQEVAVTVQREGRSLDLKVKLGGATKRRERGATT